MGRCLVSKARRLPGWEPKMGLSQGMQNLAERHWASQVITN